MDQQRMGEIRQLLSKNGPTETTLREIEVKLRLMANQGNFDHYRRAVPGEELTHKLDVPTDGGAALYLVSDGVGVVTPPHKHETWAIIIGLEGQEMNQIYKSTSSKTNNVEQIDVEIIGRDDSIIMSHEDIHGTVSVGPEATFHLHLYGVDLSTLAPIADRTYTAAPVRHQN